jgi:hypothetical protein
MIQIDPSLNELEVLAVAGRLEQAGVKDYTLKQGNNCIWASHGRINEYYIFKNGYLVDIQVD